MTPAALSVDVLLCTFRRPQVAATLGSLDAQALPAGLAMRVVVADNDDTPSARETVERAAASMRHPLTYLHAPARNIARARNACLDAATAELVAFIDDDETAAADWLARLIDRLESSGADAVFGPSEALYGPDAPGWMRLQDHHSNRPVRRDGMVETGHTCNALLRWAGTPWQRARFDLARGRSGGEDTEFFFRLRRQGARFEIAPDARVFEPVDPARLSLAWMRRRKFGMGRSYACRAGTPAARLRLLTGAAAKTAFCFAMAVVRSPDVGGRSAWILRGALHAGVCAGCLSPAPGADLYGG